MEGQQQQPQQPQQQPGQGQHHHKRAPRQAGALPPAADAPGDAAAAAASAAAIQAMGDRKRRGAPQRAGTGAATSANGSGSAGPSMDASGAHRSRPQGLNQQQGAGQIQQGTYEYQQPRQHRHDYGVSAPVLPHQPFQYANNFSYQQPGYDYSSYNQGYTYNYEQDLSTHHQYLAGHPGQQQRGRGRGVRGRGRASAMLNEQQPQQPADHLGEFASQHQDLAQGPPSYPLSAHASNAPGPAAYGETSHDIGGRGGRGRGRGRGRGNAARAPYTQEGAQQQQQAAPSEAADHTASTAAAGGQPQQQRRRQRQQPAHEQPALAHTGAHTGASDASRQAHASQHAASQAPSARQLGGPQARRGRDRRDLLALTHTDGSGAEQGSTASPQRLHIAQTGHSEGGQTAGGHKSRGTDQQGNRQQGPTAGARRRKNLPIITSEAVAQAGQQEEEHGPTVTCCICFQDVQAISVGACNHWEVCAQCCLRLRLLFKDNRCPMCKSDNETVVLLRPPAQSSADTNTDGATSVAATDKQQPVTGGNTTTAAEASNSSGNVPDFKTLVAQKDKLWMQPRWAKGVYVQSFSPGIQGTQRPLHTVLQRMTARACAHCDPSGARPFMTDKQLQDHVWHSHGLQLCQLCMAHGHKFALEAELFNQKELVAHQKATHPRCKFCQTNFYGTDELFHHMQHEHYYCHVCRRVESEYVYFRDANKLVEHFRSEHYLCEEPECAGCQTAFSTQEELIIHYHQRHPKRMPQWDTARGRPLVLDLTSALLSASVTGAGRGVDAAPRASTSSARRGQQGNADRATRQPPRLGDVVESTGGLMLIDDQEQIGGHDAGASSGGTGGRQGTAPRAFGSWATASLARPSGAPHAEEFPSLQAAAQGSTAPAAVAAAHGFPSISSGTTAAATLAAGPPAGLRKVTVHCPCGRRSYHLALREGQAAPPLPCDQECQRIRRRNNLAEAFGVSDPDHHTSYWDRQGREVNWAPALLQAAQQEPAWITLVEGQVAGLVADSATRRLVMDPMTSRQRALVHQLAEAYGLATSATGHEPHRRIQLLKTAATAPPRTSLMSASTAISSEEVEVLLASQFSATEAAKLKLVDVAPGVNVAHYFRDWTDHCTISQPTSSTAIVTFTKESAMKSALATLGGGIRGVFRIERPAAASTSTASQRPPVSSHPSASSSSAASRAAAGQQAGSGWLSINRKGRGGAVLAPAAGRMAVRTASGSIRSVVDPWLTEDEAAIAEREATEAAIRAAAGDREEFVFDSWEEQAGSGAVSVFPTSHAASDVVRGAAEGRAAGSSSAAVAGVLRAHAPLPVEATQWELLEEEEAAPGTEESQGDGDNSMTDGNEDEGEKEGEEEGEGEEEEGGEGEEVALDEEGGKGEEEDENADGQGPDALRENEGEGKEEHEGALGEGEGEGGDAMENNGEEGGLMQEGKGESEAAEREDVDGGTSRGIDVQEAGEQVGSEKAEVQEVVQKEGQEEEEEVEQVGVFSERAREEVQATEGGPMVEGQGVQVEHAAAAQEGSWGSREDADAVAQKACADTREEENEATTSNQELAHVSS